MHELTTERRFAFALAVVIGAVLGAAYANSFSVGFIFDDSYGIAQNPAIRSLKNLPRFFTDPYLLTPIRANVDVRPVLMITFALNYALSGLAPWSWHALNLMLHFGCALLVFVIVRDHFWLGKDARWPAAAAALFFALAPINQQPVVYVWARSSLLCTFFALAAFLAFVRANHLTAATFFTLALLTKAIAATLPLLCLLWLILGRRKIGSSLWPMLAALAAYLIYRAEMLPPGSVLATHEVWVTPRIWLMSGWTSYLYYLRLFLWPDALSADHDFAYNLSLFTPRTLISLGAVAAWLALALSQWRKRPWLTFATAWYFLALAPETTLAPLGELVNDHRPYFGVALGLAPLLALLLWTWPRALAGVTACACLAAIPVVRERNWIWQDPLRLWLDTEAKSPGNGRAAMNAGRELMRLGRLDEARRHFDRALQLMPENTYLFMNLSVLERAQGNPEAAFSAARRALELAPDNEMAKDYYRQAAGGESLMQQGLDALQRGDAQAAQDAFARVLQQDPGHYGATYQSAVALEKLGRVEEARKQWARVADLAARYHDAAVARTASEHLAR